jgi:hypothetical protein
MPYPYEEISAYSDLLSNLLSNLLSDSLSERQRLA